MAAQTPRAFAPVVTLSQNRAVTTSKDVADCFGKRHDNVMRDIENLLSELPSDHLLSFEETLIERENPSGGAPIKSPAYEITRDGFTLLAMGFTGKKALQFKLAYIDAFNQMEAKLRAMAPAVVDQILSSTIGASGFRTLGALVCGKVSMLPAASRRRATMKLWSQVHAAFNVQRAEDIPADQLDSARNFVAAYVLEGELLEAPRKPDAVVLDDGELVNVYALLVAIPLFRDVQKRAEAVLRAAESPLASKMFDAWNETGFACSLLARLRERCEAAQPVQATLPHRQRRVS